jgi:hypothetical protein
VVMEERCDKRNPIGKMDDGHIDILFQFRTGQLVRSIIEIFPKGTYHEPATKARIVMF